MQCADSRALLDAYLDGELSERERVTVREHLAGCADCSRELAALERASALAQEHLMHYEAPDVLKARIASAIAGERAGSSDTPPARATPRRWWRLVAAGVLIALASGSLTYAVMRARAPSHTMADVSYHFSNLWFAAQAENWPLAQFYSDEAHSHLRWAVRVIPKRKDRDGRDVDLDGILTAFEQTSLKDLDAAIKAKDKTRFTAAYKAQMENCMACHRAASKEFIRLHIPDHPETPIVDFTPPPQPAQ